MNQLNSTLNSLVTLVQNNFMLTLTLILAMMYLIKNLLGETNNFNPETEEEDESQERAYSPIQSNRDDPSIMTEREIHHPSHNEEGLLTQQFATQEESIDSLAECPIMQREGGAHAEPYLLPINSSLGQAEWHE